MTAEEIRDMGLPAHATGQAPADLPAKAPTLVEQLDAAYGQIAALGEQIAELRATVEHLQAHQTRRDGSEDGRERRLAELEERVERIVGRIGFAGEA